MLGQLQLIFKSSTQSGAAVRKQFSDDSLGSGNSNKYYRPPQINLI